MTLHNIQPSVNSTFQSTVPGIYEHTLDLAVGQVMNILTVADTNRNASISLQYEGQPDSKVTVKVETNQKRGQQRVELGLLLNPNEMELELHQLGHRS